MIKAANKTLHEMKRNTSGTPIMDSPHAPWPCPPKGPWPNPPNCGSMMGGLGPIFGALAEGLDQGKLESYPASRGVETNVKPNTLWPCPPCGPWPSPPMCSCKKSCRTNAAKTPLEHRAKCNHSGEEARRRMAAV